jgi:hypothetical protein
MKHHSTFEILFFMLQNKFKPKYSEENELNDSNNNTVSSNRPIIKYLIFFILVVVLSIIMILLLHDFASR